VKKMWRNIHLMLDYNAGGGVAQGRESSLGGILCKKTSRQQPPPKGCHCFFALYFAFIHQTTAMIQAYSVWF
jgi:hypothetical protein